MHEQRDFGIQIARQLLPHRLSFRASAIDMATEIVAEELDRGLIGKLLAEDLSLLVKARDTAGQKTGLHLTRQQIPERPPPHASFAQDLTLVVVHKEAEMCTYLQYAFQLSSRLVDVAVLNAKQADCRIEAAISEWQGFHTHPRVDCEIRHARYWNVRPIDAGNVQIASTAEESVSGYTRAASKIDHLRAARKAIRELRPVSIHRVSPVAGNIASLMRHILRAGILPECGPEAWPCSAVFHIASRGGRATGILRRAAAKMTAAGDRLQDDANGSGFIASSAPMPLPASRAGFIRHCDGAGGFMPVGKCYG